MRLLFILGLLVSTAAYATCIRDFTRCEAQNKFQNIYHLETVRCSPPGGPVHKTTTMYIYNPLVSSCAPIPRQGCMKPIVERELNKYRHTYFQADIKIVGKHAFLKMDDRRFLQQGDFHISTPGSNYMLLDGYTCVMNGEE